MKEVAIEKPTGLALLRQPFPAHQISKLPKPTKKQTETVRNDFRSGIRCQLCGQWHHPEVVHLDYVGHAALTDRLLDCDPEWNWEPVALAADGSPALDANGGMWIRLTVCGVTRLGYGHADGKKGGDAVKEVIGDALRNAAMRFGAALDLWHKGDLHGDDGDQGPADDDDGQAADKRPGVVQTISPEQFIKLRDKCEEAGVTPEQLCSVNGAPSLKQFPAADFDAAMRKLDATIRARHDEEESDRKAFNQQREPNAADDVYDDEIPY